MRFPLYSKILLCFFLNLAVLVAVFLLLFRFQFHFGLNSLLTSKVGERIGAVSEWIASELRENPRENWNGVLARASNAYHVKFLLFGYDNNQIAGETVALPPEIRASLLEMRPPIPADDRPRPPLDGERDFRQDDPPPDERFAPPAGRPRETKPAVHLRNLIRTTNPNRYWVLVHIPLNTFTGPRQVPATLMTVSESLSAGGLFFDFKPLLFAVACVFVFSVLFWLPLVGGVTRSIATMTRATGCIAEGRFETRVPITRRDELGSLGEAVNRMASRLAGFVNGQKRFLGDIAHELCSPLARMQIALAILEERAGVEQREYVADVREEVEQMSGLVNELLSFSKASLGGKNVALKPVFLSEITQHILTRENRLKGGVVVDVPPGLAVLADPELLSRAIGNVIRNAIRYANPVNAGTGARNYTYRPKQLGDGKPAGPIVVTAHKDGGHVVLTIADNGPGIPDAALAQIFDPFYRVDTSRARETGGVGLGLAIVKTCVESCGGTVTCRNREPSGLEVTIKLQAG